MAPAACKISRALNSAGSRRLEPEPSVAARGSAHARFISLRDGLPRDRRRHRKLRRIHTEYPDSPLDLIEAHVIGWLEMEFALPTHSREQLELDELDRLTEAWVKDQERQSKAAKKEPETHHSWVIIKELLLKSSREGSIIRGLLGF